MVGEVLLTKTKDRKIRLGKKPYQEKKNVPIPIVIKLHIFTMYNRCSENVIDNLFKVQFKKYHIKSRLKHLKHLSSVVTHENCFEHLKPIFTKTLPSMVLLMKPRAVELHYEEWICHCKLP